MSDHIIRWHIVDMNLQASVDELVAAMNAFGISAKSAFNEFTAWADFLSEQAVIEGTVRDGAVALTDFHHGGVGFEWSVVEGILRMLKGYFMGIVIYESGNIERLYYDDSDAILRRRQIDLSEMYYAVVAAS